MNKAQLEKLDVIYSKLNVNLVHMKNLIRVIDNYKPNKLNIGLLMDMFTLTYNDVVFVSDHLKDIKGEEVCRSCNEYTECRKEREESL